MSGAIPPPSQYALMAWCSVETQGQLHLYLITAITSSGMVYRLLHIRGCIQKFPDWPLEARTENGRAVCHQVQLHRYLVSQSSEFCHPKPLCCFSTSVSCCYGLFRYRLSPETFGYTLVNGL
jgi:hypothetical protein